MIHDLSPMGTAIKLMKSLDVFLARVLSQWAMWCVGFLIGFVLGGAVGNAMISWSGGGWWLASEKANPFLWGTALLGAGLGAYFLDRLGRHPSCRRTGFPETYGPRNAAIAIAVVSGFVVLVA